MSLSRAPGQYDQRDQDRLRADIEKMDGANRKLGQDVEIAGSERLIQTSPDGNRWHITVDNAGTILAVAIP